MPEFLKKLFGDKAMTYDEFKKAYDAQESAKDGVKLANLTDGGYVSQQKFRDKETELKTATDTLTGLQETVKKFDGVDVEKLKKDTADAQKKFDADLATVRRDSAVDLMLVQAGARNVKAAKALIDMSKVKLKDDGSVEGVDVEGLKKSDPYLFTIEQTKDEGDGHAGAAGAGDDKAGTLESEIMAALQGSST